MLKDETSPQQRFAFVSKQFSSNPEHAQRLYDYASQHWLSYSTPILSHGTNKRGLGISCFLSYMDDTSAGLVDTLSEVNWLSMMGGGIGVGVSIRSSDDKSVGVMPHMKIYDASCLAYRQGYTRRGSYAMYLDISHPDIIQFLEMRKPTGDPNIRCLNLHHGINITDDFMNIIEQCMLDKDAKDDWQLKDPNSDTVVATISAKDLWQRILDIRMSTGEPYLHFIDTSNRNQPECHKKMGLSVKMMNLCAEISLPSDKQRTAVCCLSSLNLEYYDKWNGNHQFYRDVAEMLDNVLTFFIDNSTAPIKRAKYSALHSRAIGIGALGFHSYLQSKSIPFESAMSKSLNMNIFKTIRKHLDEVNLELGGERGEAPDTKGTGQRFSHVTAVAPNASSSILMGNCSPSIEPFRANCYRQDTLSGSSLAKNKYLNALLRELIDNDDKLQEVWKSITVHDGSVQHLDILTDDQKAIFKTAMEIDQRWIIDLASDRQLYIDQGQSVNIFFTPGTHIKYLHAVHFLAWKKQLKSLYYCRSDSIRKADKVSQQIDRKIIEELDMKSLVDDTECLACQ
jgi:ribonucleoside-diphosphate reductase alpha chain